MAQRMKLTDLMELPAQTIRDTKSALTLFAMEQYGHPRPSRPVKACADDYANVHSIMRPNLSQSHPAAFAKQNEIVKHAVDLDQVYVRRNGKARSYPLHAVPASVFNNTATYYCKQRGVWSRSDIDNTVNYYDADHHLAATCFNVRGRLLSCYVRTDFELK